MNFLGTDFTREIDGLSAFEPPAWVPDGALMVVDFANGRYWRSDIGVCAVTDIIPTSGTFNPATDIVPGIGLTTGDRTGETIYGRGGYVTAGAYALLTGGFSLRMDFDIAVTTTQIGNDWVYTQVAWWDAGFNQELLANAYVGNAGTKYLRGEVYNFAPGSSSDVADSVISSGPYDAFAANFDPAAGTVLMSRDGVTQDSAVYASTYSGLSQILIWANYEPSGTGTFTGNASIRKLVFYPQMDQTGINALSQRQGNVTGPASATDNAVPRFNGPTGKDLQNSLTTISDTGTVTAFANATDYTEIIPRQNFRGYLNSLGYTTQLIFDDGSGNGTGSGLAMGANSFLRWRSVNRTDSGANDIGLSRLSAGVLGVGNGTQGSFAGELKLTTLTFADGNSMIAADLAKLDGIESGATANSPDATLLARANHTGTQAAATISDFTEASQDVVGAMVAAAGGSYDDGAGTITLPGGGGSPGGTSGELQYNDGAGGFAGAANVEISGDNLKLVSTTDPAAPTGGLLLYSKSIAGRHLPKIIGPSGIDTVMQVGLHGNSVFMFGPASGTTAPVPWGGTLTTAATMSMQLTVASANPWQATQRKRFQSAATAGSNTGCRTAYVQWFRGNAAGFGGFFFRAKFGQNLNVNGAQCFVGLCASTGALATTAGAVGALLNMIGVGYDTTDANTGNWQLFRNDGSGTATKVDLGATNAARNTTHGYDLIIYCPPGAATEIFVRIVNIHTGAVVLDTSYTTDLPAVNTGMAFKAECNNGAVASAQNIELAKVYIESDYWSQAGARLDPASPRQ